MRPYTRKFRGLISIHAPREGSDRILSYHTVYCLIFQSTLPVRGATLESICGMLGNIQFQSTLPVRGATYMLIINGLD